MNDIYFQSQNYIDIKFPPDFDVYTVVMEKNVLIL